MAESISTAQHHFDEAEGWIRTAQRSGSDATVHLQYAQVHATLALAAIQATALPPRVELDEAKAALDLAAVTRQLARERRDKR